jgi:uncharacterized protein YhfF
MQESNGKEAVNAGCLTKIGKEEYIITDVQSFAVCLIHVDTVTIFTFFSLKRHFLLKHEGCFTNLSLNERQKLQRIRIEFEKSTAE